MAKWREIKNQRIQTSANEVFLWDSTEGVACRVKVEKYPWTKIDPDFTHWQSADGWLPSMFPPTYPAGMKPSDAHFTGPDALVGMAGDDGTMVLNDFGYIS